MKLIKLHCLNADVVIFVKNFANVQYVLKHDFCILIVLTNCCIYIIQNYYIIATYC